MSIVSVTVSSMSNLLSDYRINLPRGKHIEEYFLKLCGSGGGGFVMGFTRDYENIKDKFKEFDPEVVYRF